MPFRLLISSTADYPFIQDDVDALQEEFEIDRYVGNGIDGVIENFRRAGRADVSISWFGSVYTAPMVRGAQGKGKGSIVILGGVDTACDHQMGYGLWRSRWKGRMLAWGLRHADVVFAVDESLRRSLERCSGQSWPDIRILPTGYDPDAWTAHGERHRTVLTVATLDIPQRVQIKGIDLLVEAARRLPDIPFDVVGVHPAIDESLRGLLPPNVTLHRPIPREELRHRYSGAAVYCQPSRREGLPNTLCEAMLCGCIPVGTEVGGIPGVIGETGWIVPSDDVVSLVNAIREAIDGTGERRNAARARIVERYSRTERRRKLIETITHIAHAKTDR